MDIYRRLSQDHAWQRELANLILETGSDDPDRKRLYRTLRKEVEAHAYAEGQTLYPVVLSIPECHLLARRGMFAHQQISDQMRDLDKHLITSDEWLQNFIRLRNDLEHFSCEEEESLFPEARMHIPHSTASQLVDDYRARKSACAARRWSGHVPPTIIGGTGLNGRGG